MGLRGGTGQQVSGQPPGPTPHTAHPPHQGATAHKLCRFGSRSRKQVSAAPESQVVSLVLCLSDSSLKPRGGISSEEYQSIDMGPDSLSEQNTKASSLRCFRPVHPNCSLGARFPALWTLSRALRLQGLDSAPSGEVQPWVCRGEGGRQADAKTEDQREAEANPTALLLLLLRKPLLLLPVTVPHPKDMWPWSLTSFHFRESPGSPKIG